MERFILHVHLARPLNGFENGSNLAENRIGYVWMTFSGWDANTIFFFSEPGFAQFAKVTIGFTKWNFLRNKEKAFHIREYIWLGRGGQAPKNNSRSGLFKILNTDCFYDCSAGNNVVVFFRNLKVQSFILAEVSGCCLLRLIVITSSTFLKGKDMFKEKKAVSLDYRNLQPSIYIDKCNLYTYTVYMYTGQISFWILPALQSSVLQLGSHQAPK